MLYWNFIVAITWYACVCVWIFIHKWRFIFMIFISTLTIHISLYEPDRQLCTICMREILCFHCMQSFHDRHHPILPTIFLFFLLQIPITVCSLISRNHATKSEQQVDGIIICQFQNRFLFLSCHFGLFNTTNCFAVALGYVRTHSVSTPNLGIERGFFFFFFLFFHIFTLIMFTFGCFAVEEFLVDILMTIACVLSCIVPQSVIFFLS